MEHFATLFLHSRIPSIKNTKRASIWFRDLILSIPTQYPFNEQLCDLLEVKRA
jgi:hypothetical protein